MPKKNQKITCSPSEVWHFKIRNQRLKENVANQIISKANWQQCVENKTDEINANRCLILTISLPLSPPPHPLIKEEKKKKSFNEESR